MTIWGPYSEIRDAMTGQYLLYRSPHPSPVSESHEPILKDPVSLFLTEILKPARISSTIVRGETNGRRASDVPSESVIRASVAMMDNDVLRKVRAAENNLEAISILEQYDPRFGDMGRTDDGFLRYFRQAERQRNSKKPGPQPSQDRVKARVFIHANMDRLRPLLFEPNTKKRRKSRTEAARLISLEAFECPKVLPSVTRTLREDYPYKRRTHPA
jgi:hypothetical protein